MKSQKPCCCFFPVMFAAILFFTIPSQSRIRLTLSDGSLLEGEKISENLNFLLIDADGFSISILKTRIVSENQLTSAPIASQNIARPCHNQDTAVLVKSLDTTNTAPPAIVTVSPSWQPQPPTWDDLLKTADTAKVLDLSYRGLEKIPASITVFRKLRHLDIKGNRLTAIPADIGDMTSLVSIDARMNRLACLPHEMINLTGLKYLLLTGNKICDTELFHLRRALTSTEIISNTVFCSQATRRLHILPCDYGRCDTLDSSCRSGDCSSCYELGIIYKKNYDSELALTAFTKGCDLSKPDTSTFTKRNCEESASIYSSVINDEKSAEIYRQHVSKISR